MLKEAVVLCLVCALITGFGLWAFCALDGERQKMDSGAVNDLMCLAEALLVLVVKYAGIGGTLMFGILAVQEMRRRRRSVALVGHQTP